MTFGEKVIQFNKNLHYTGDPLPPGIAIMNPYRESPQAMKILETFSEKYFNDHYQRNLILGINPGRFGGGLTGIPFTDPKRLLSASGITYEGRITHEPSSVFVYEVINAYGGPEKFYKDFYINSPCPLGFVSVDSTGREKNYNYYDSKELFNSVSGFMTESIKKLIALGVSTNKCICLGTGKNEKFLNKLNEQHCFFEEIIAIEHPRFIMQYKSKSKKIYIDKYLRALDIIKHDNAR